MAPIALGLSARYGTAPLIAAVLGVTGIISGMLSPLAVYGVSARNLGDSLGLGLPDSAPVTLFAGGILAGLIVCAGCLVVGLRTGAIPRGRLDPLAAGAGHSARSAGTGDRGGAAGGPLGSGSPLGRAAGTAESGAVQTVDAPKAEVAATPSVPVLALTLCCFAAVLVLSVGFDMNIGYLGLCAAVVVQTTLRMDATEIVARVPWNGVLLIGGLLTYVGLMQDLGAFERIGDLLRVEGAPMISLLVLCYIAAVTSFAASSIAVFVTTMPLLPAVVEAGVSPVGAVLALALASILVDINPLGITGGLILGAAEPEVRGRLFRQLLVYGLVSIVVSPLVVWAVFGWW